MNHESSGVLRRLALLLVALIFAVFVWPTPYRADHVGTGIRKTNRVGWALNLDHSRDTGDEGVWAATGFGIGVTVGLVVGAMAGGALVERRLRKSGNSSKGAAGP